MDTKRLITALALGMGIILIYNTALPWLDHKMGWDKPPVASTEPPTTQPAASQPASTTGSIAGTQPVENSSTSTSGISAAATPSVQVMASTQPAVNTVPAIIGSAVHGDAQFALQLSIEPTGAGLGQVLVNGYQEAGGKHPYVFQQPLPSRLDTEPLGSKSVTVDGATYDLAGLKWSLIKSSPAQATYGADLVRNGIKLLSLTKTFTVPTRSGPNEGLEVRVDLGFENQTALSQKIHAVLNGPTLPPPETTRPPDRQVVGGYVVDKDTIDIQSHPIEEFKADKNNGEVDLFKDPKGHPVRWAGEVSNYFGAIVLPLDMVVNGTASKTDFLAAITAHGVNIDSKLPIEEHNAYLTFQTTDLTLEPGKPITLPFSVYLGPKWRKVLDTPYYSAFPRDFDLLGIIRSSMCGISFCTFPWLSTFIVWLLGVMHAVFRDWGLAIIGLVAIVRFLLHPITRSSQISMAKMSKMGPEMERLKKKYGDDKEALNKAMVEFHREQGLGPYLGCLPMFLQMPIWIALYGVLQSTFELRQAPFLYGITWIHDLAQPDYLVNFGRPVQVFFFTLHGINLLPVLLAGVMFIQTKYFMPKPAAATPEQLQQQKMMQFISPTMFLFFFYGLPSGLNIYIFTSTAVGIVESKIIRDHLKAREEAEKSGKVFIETKPTRASRQRALPGGPVEPEKPYGLAGRAAAFWAKLLEQAEQARNNDPKGGNGKKRP